MNIQIHRYIIIYIYIYRYIDVYYIYTCEKYINIPSEKYIYVHKYVYICVYTYLCKMDEYRYYAGLS